MGSGPVEQYNRAVDGIADIAFGIPEYTPAIFPKTNLIALPGLGRGEVGTTEQLWNVKEAYLDDEFSRVKLLALWGFDGAVLMTTEKPVTSLADLEGMKIRSPGSMGTATLEAWGATPVNMPISEAYNALNTGVVDGILVGPSAIRSFKLNEVVSYIMFGTPEVRGSQYLIMNRDSWDALSAEQQANIEAVTGKALSITASEAYSAASASGLALAEETGIEFIQLSDEAIAEFEAATAPVYAAVVEELAGQGIPAADILAALQAE